MKPGGKFNNMNILIVDDHPIIRLGIKNSLLLESNIENVFEASNVSEGISCIQKNNPNIAIVDIGLNKENGLEIIERCKGKCNTKFLVLTSSIKKDDFYKAKRLDVEGYVLKEAFIEDIIYALNLILRGKKYFDPEIVEYTSNHMSFNTLTSREYDVLVELGRGLSNSEIATNLYITEHTVKKHISSILAKLELNNRTEAALYAASLSSISLNSYSV